MRGIVATSVDEYLAVLPSYAARENLSRLRTIIRDEVPEAKEVISYGMPMYMFHGMVVGFAAFKKHASLFPGHTVADFAEHLKEYKTSKGTIQFSHDHQMPEPLVRAIVRFRADENLRNSRPS